MIDFTALTPQLTDFVAYRHDEDARQADRLCRALQALSDCVGAWQALADRADGEGRGPLRAIPLGCPDAAHDAPARPPTVTVVATDGSQIFPDRHVDPACYLLNIGRVALHYGTTEAPLIAAEPSLRYRRADLAELESDDAEIVGDLSAEVVSALRDELELTWLFETAEHQRRSGRPIVALADGTLIRWMLRGMKNRALEDRLIQRYVEQLDRFQAEGVPVASYISRPANAEVVNLLRLHLGEPDWDAGPDSIQGVEDRELFAECLAVGQRSALFRSRSAVLKQYGPHQMLAFYVRLEGEVGRVELPAWVADQPDWVDLIHAVVLDQCDKGAGYPIILQEAHERAVVRAAEKEMFYGLLARHVRAGGTGVPTYSGKAASKRAPRV